MSSSTSIQVFASNDDDFQRRIAKKRKNEQKLNKEDAPNPNLNPFFSNFFAFSF